MVYIKFVLRNKWIAPKKKHPIIYSQFHSHFITCECTLCSTHIKKERSVWLCVSACWQERRGGTAWGEPRCQLNTALVDDHRLFSSASTHFGLLNATLLLLQLISQRLDLGT